MKAFIYYIDNMTADFCDEINEKGWECELGRKYFEAKRGSVPYTDNIYILAAVTDAFENAEEIWTAMQNHFNTWSSKREIRCLTDAPRSMDVGDIIVWKDGKVEHCAPVGFKTVN